MKSEISSRDVPLLTFNYLILRCRAIAELGSISRALRTNLGRTNHEVGTEWWLRKGGAQVDEPSANQANLFIKDNHISSTAEDLEHFRVQQRSEEHR
uniref:Uncharacterized protein n=1 Tax=Ascaris lumbricoides TaxID=6252 RepID=A0A0M3HQU6_ASCLU